MTTTKGLLATTALFGLSMADVTELFQCLSAIGAFAVAMVTLAVACAKLKTEKLKRKNNENNL